ncbi:ABC transporter substrate-binding protein [Vibrio astriarenae]|uniref:ABC transporter substrate-binding protein n=1 Tax=Vibrio astriarenae TaxID=1481923 RepID=A0A7Z2T7F1_9VIBR|nr:ABC transporter substrate-binding protein [Vibrio astriarenae]QIA65754.1 ABC transporter substrate-binding protein [Vibrio astriarenae]
MKVQRAIKWLLITCCLGFSAHLAADEARVYISQIIDHPALNSVKKGLVEGLAEAGYQSGKNLTIEYQVANGSTSEAVQIARQFVGENPDVMVGIATPTAQALVASSRSIPIVFTAVTDPVGAHLVKRLDEPGRNVTGLSDLSPISQHLDLLKELLPETKRVGVLFNPGEANSVALLERIEAQASQRGLTIIQSEVLRNSDVKHLSKRLSKQVDVIYAMTDNTIASAIDDLIAPATEQNVPVFSGAVDYVEMGAIAGLGFDYYQIGKETAEYVVRVLEGEEPGSIPVRVAKGSDLAVNIQAAQRLGIEIPQSVKARVTQLY